MRELGGGGRLEGGNELLHVGASLRYGLVFLRDATAGVEHGRVVAAAQGLANFDE